MGMPSFRLDGKVALVTGAGSGIGAGIAQGLAAFGAAVGCVDTSSAGLDTTVRAITAAGGRAIAINADVRDELAMETAVANTEAAFGPLGVALNCAGVHDNVPATDMTREQWQRVVDTNLTGVFVSSQVEGRAMIRNGGGSIVNIGSVSAHICNRGLPQVHYNAAKAGVAHLSRSLALEWAQHDVRVNVISPGYTATPMAKKPEVWEMVKHLVNDIPMGRMCEVDELIGPAVFLLSDASSYCTGVDLVVDGGAIRW
jgi:NAD(P)-dependent dehydrogenase (short-subunit alcohol dehydrogenase family)